MFDSPSVNVEYISNLCESEMKILHTKRRKRKSETYERLKQRKNIAGLFDSSLLWQLLYISIVHRALWYASFGK